MFHVRSPMKRFTVCYLPRIPYRTGRLSLQKKNELLGASGGVSSLVYEHDMLWMWHPLQ